MHWFTFKYNFFLSGRAQLKAAEVKESHNVMSVRIYVECAIQRVQKFKAI